MEFPRKQLILVGDRVLITYTQALAVSVK